MSERYPASVVAVINSREIVINRGTADGVRAGARFLVYRMGNEIFDPATNESLGTLEIVLGTGFVSHVQEKMATIVSDTRSRQAKTVVKSGFAVFGEERIEVNFEPFASVDKLDLVKPL
jgi:hypothetical protein